MTHAGYGVQACTGGAHAPAAVRARACRIPARAKAVRA